jgi:putative ABC transport system permease protein
MHGPVTKPQPEPARPLFSRLPLALRLALREVAGGLRGFGIFLGCLALGVWAIAAVGSVSRSLVDGLNREGRVILGADIAFSLPQREANAQERAYLEGLGRLGVVATMRAMVNAGDKGSGLVELKAVDGAYPMLGTMKSTPATPLPELLATRDGVAGALADPALMARLGLSVGDEVSLGVARIRITSVIEDEPDKVAEGVGFAPRLMVSQETLRASGLLQPGSLVRWNYRIVLPPERSADSDLGTVEAQAKGAFPDAGWTIRSRVSAEPRFARNIERFTQFLALVGLTALVVGGVGVANAVHGFVDRKRIAIAVMKSLGAPGGRVVAVHLVQVLMVATLGIIAGLAAGAATPFAVARLAEGQLPLPLNPTLAPGELLLAAAYGYLVALAFALGPLGRAHDIPVAALFRDRVERDGRWPRPIYMIGVGLALAGLVALALVSTMQTKVAAIFLACAAGAYFVLQLVAMGLMALMRRLPRPRRPLLRLAMANIHRPGAVTPALMLSLGLGVTLLVVIALVDGNLRRNLSESLPDKAPSFFFIDIPSARTANFDAMLQSQAPGSTIDRVPMMRGRVVSVKGVPAEQVQAAENIGWVLEGDRGITFSDTPPAGSSVIAGQWWEPGYRGTPLVSFDEEIAQGLGLTIGDSIVVNVLGRRIEAKVANLRRIEWRTMGINFVMVFSPNTFAGAPHTHLATVALPDGGTTTPAVVAHESAIIRTLAQDFPTVTAIRVRDAMQAVNDVVGKLSVAVRGASLVVLVASLLVLGGALAAGHRARLYDAVILKTLGATRGRLLFGYALEYGLIGLCAAAVGLVAGTIASWFVIVRVMAFRFSFAPVEALGAAALAIVVAILLGLIGAWHVLGQKPARHLRNT